MCSNFLQSNLLSFISAFSRTSFFFSVLFRATFCSFWHMLLSPHVTSVRANHGLCLVKEKVLEAALWGSEQEGRLSATLQITPLKTSAVFGTILSQSRASFSTTQASRYVTLSSYCATLTKIPSFEAQHFLWRKVSPRISQLA